MKEKITHGGVDVRHSPLRRRFLGLTIAAAASLAMPPAFANLGHLKERRLSFHNLHTGERVSTVYWSQGHYVEDGLAEINHVLRDFRTDQVIEMDPQLMDLLHQLRATVGVTKKPFEIISGYRSPDTNAMLRSKSSGVAKRSLHMEGKAADIRIPGLELGHLRQAALSLKAGGVGYYPKSGFVHVDTGRVRSW